METVCNVELDSVCHVCRMRARIRLSFFFLFFSFLIWNFWVVSESLEMKWAARNRSCNPTGGPDDDNEPCRIKSYVWMSMDFPSFLFPRHSTTSTHESNIKRRSGRYTCTFTTVFLPSAFSSEKDFIFSSFQLLGLLVLFFRLKDGAGREFLAYFFWFFGLFVFFVVVGLLYSIGFLSARPWQVPVVVYCIVNSWCPLMLTHSRSRTHFLFFFISLKWLFFYIFPILPLLLGLWSSSVKWH